MTFIVNNRFQSPWQQTHACVRGNNVDSTHTHRYQIYACCCGHYAAVHKSVQCYGQHCDGKNLSCEEINTGNLGTSIPQASGITWRRRQQSGAVQNDVRSVYSLSCLWNLLSWPLPSGSWKTWCVYCSMKMYVHKHTCMLQKRSYRNINNEK